MSASDAPPLDVATLGQLLRDADPAALLVPPRLLRRVIKRERKLTNLGTRVPHRRCYVVGREALFAHTDRDELGLEPGRELPPTVLLIAAPEPEALAALARDEALVEYWRLLFHARVHQTLAERVALTPAVVRGRIHAIGQTAFDEVRTVLRQEKLLLPPRDARTAYEEFAAFYLELRHFAAPLVPHYFPALTDPERIDAILAQDVDAAALFAATRPAGAPEPSFVMEEEPSPEQAAAVESEHSASTEHCDGLIARAERAAAAGNVVRAALYRTRATRGTHAELDELVARLRRALHLGDADADAWRQALPALLPPAAGGIWPPEARLLYDLQKVCVDHERPVYSPDLVEWAYSLFREPLVRPLPYQPLVLAVKHLRGAVRLLPAVRLADAERTRLSDLLHGALHHAEGRLRDRFRPLLLDVLREVNLLPHNFPERVGRDKLVEELLDRVVERGFLNMGDLRDALARNDLKLPDLAGPQELLLGDSLLRANRKLAGRAPGVYRRAEVYLRGFQRASALAFGTPVGRWFTLFLALPLGAAYGTVAIVQEVVHLMEKLKPAPTAPAHEGEIPDPAQVSHQLGPIPLAITVGVLGVFFLLLIHSATFRHGLWRAIQRAGDAARAVFLDFPQAVLRLPLVRRLLDSRPFLFFARYVLKPVPFAILTFVALWAGGVGASWAIISALGVFLVLSLLLNSRLGRDIEEVATDWTARKWEYLQDLLPGLFRLVMDFFKGVLEVIDAGLYAVDEWLRFRGGQGRASLVAKTILRFVWFLASYAIRLLVVVFIEPWVNPIKHFPAVTVAAKLLLPLFPALMKFFGDPLMFLTAPVAYAIAFVLVKAIPGAAGFLAWELRENWRLYEANRPEQLGPIVVGHHGETVLRLMKPGIHSGTLPKLYAKLRKARRRGTGKTARKLREELHEVEEQVRHFAERELLALLHGSKGWPAGRVQVVSVRAGSNRIHLELACPALGEADLELSFEEQSGWLLAGIAWPGWLPRLSAQATSVLETALTGFYKKAGVDLTREQIAAGFAPECPPYDVADDGLVVWPGGKYDVMFVYDLSEEGPEFHPRIVEGKPVGELPVLRAELLFDRRPVTWQEWVAAWERDQTGKAPPEPMVSRVIGG